MTLSQINNLDTGFDARDKINDAFAIIDILWGVSASGGTGSTGSVDSVNGQVGIVSLTTTDIPEGDNLYFTNSLVQTYLDTLALIDGSGMSNYLPIFLDTNTLTSSIIYSDGSVVGFGTMTPNTLVHVESATPGAFRLVDTTEGSGKVLTSDSNGIGTWQNVNMAEKITDYTAKSQDFIDTDLFDVSKHVTQTSGVLVVGKRYTILDFNVGDNFTNVASVVSGTINTTGCVFDAIGTTPTTYSNGSTLAHYETQSYTYEDLRNELNGGAQPKVYKALLTQSGTSAPVATILVNTLSGTPVWSYVGVGDYELTLANEWTANKTVIIHKSIISDDVNYKLTSIYTSSSVLNFKTFDTTTPANDMLSNAETIIIEVYP